MATTAAVQPGEFSFQGKNSLIYGAAKGIGRAVALEFARRGARVAVADIDIDGAKDTASQIVATGGSATALRCDVTNALSVREAAVAAEMAFGDIDIVMNNVGAIVNGNPEDVPLGEWERILSLNLLSVVRSNEVFMPRMLARGRGHIVNTASFAGLYPYASSRTPYVASKAAVVALSQSLALYLHPKGIRVSCFCPGPVMTGVADAMKTWSANVPMRGPGAQLSIKTAEEAASILADGMQKQRILIPTHEELWETLRQYAADPDAFVQTKIDEFARGDLGRPQLPR